MIALACQPHAAHPSKLLHVRSERRHFEYKICRDTGDGESVIFIYDDARLELNKYVNGMRSISGQDHEIYAMSSLSLQG